MLFRPTDESLSETTASQVRIHRLLTLLGILLVPVFGLLYEASGARPAGSPWTELGIAGLLSVLLAASYGSKTVRRDYVAWMRGGLYLVVAWVVLLTTLHHFAPNFALGLLFTYATLTAVVGFGAQTVVPVLRFAGVGILLTIVGALLEPAPRTSPLLLLVSMTVLGLVECALLREQAGIRRKLRERDAHLRGLTNSISGVVYQFCVHPDGTYGTHFVSEQADDLLDLSPDPTDFLERFLEHVPPPHRSEVMTSIDEVVEEERPWRYEMPFDKPSGERIWLLGTSTPAKRGNELVFNGVLLDITDRKRQKRQLKEAKEKAEEANRLKSSFLTNISHEIRTPLTSIIGFAEAIGDEAAALDRKQDAPELSVLSRFSTLIEQSGQRLLRTLNDVLHLSKLETGQMTLSPKSIELTQELEDTLALLRPQADESQLALETEMDPAPVWATVDPSGLRIVLRNLLSNAIKYTRKGGKISVRVQSDREHTEKTATLEIEDTGIGMNPDEVPRLFKAFRQGSEGVNREYEGSGLGLAVTKRIVHQMEGRIDVDTEPGVGTCFTLRFPSPQMSPSPGDGASHPKPAGHPS